MLVGSVSFWERSLALLPVVLCCSPPLRSGGSGGHPATAAKMHLCILKNAVSSIRSCVLKNAYLRVYIQAYIRTCIHAYEINEYTDIDTYIYIYTHTYDLIYIYIHIYICVYNVYVYIGMYARVENTCK